MFSTAALADVEVKIQTSSNSGIQLLNFPNRRTAQVATQVTFTNSACGREHLATQVLG